MTPSLWFRFKAVLLPALLSFARGIRGVYSQVILGQPVTPIKDNTMSRDIYYITSLVVCLLLGYVCTCTAQPFARCKCGGRCGSFNCPGPTTVYHCDCVHCRCLNRPGGTGLRNCYHSRCKPTSWKCPQYKECDFARCACAGDHLGLWGLHHGSQILE